MIDLHMHTKYSDGTDDEIEILKKAQEKNLEYISITDHNTCEVYDKLKNIDINKYYKGKIIPGIELNTKVLNVPIEILGYNIDVKAITPLLKEIYISKEKRNLIEIERLYKKCKLSGIDIPESLIRSYNPNEMFPSKYLHDIITKDLRNKEKIDEEAWESSKVFYRKYMSNPNTKLYVEMDDIVPNFGTVLNLVKKVGGLVFLPHIYEYRENSMKILDFILKNYKIDGIECYYTTFTNEQHLYLLKLCKDKGLYISGGSDYHGANKPLVDIGIGEGNLRIPSSIIKEWENI